MVSVSYDDGAASFFFITLLMLFCVPSGVYIALTVWRWSPEAPKSHVVRARCRPARAALALRHPLSAAGTLAVRV